jgi:spermidine synthase
MAWSLLLFFSYQTRAGALYGQLGLLTAVFMLGLALGGRVGARLAPGPRGTRALLVASSLALAFGTLLTLTFAFTPSFGGLPPLLTHGVALLAAGVVTGCVFPAAVGAVLPRRTAAQAAGTIEAADHAGAAAAALLGAIVFVPRLGLTGTAAVTVALQTLALAVVLIRPRSPGSRADSRGTSPS